jgi:outer membrane protein assembly factor BamB
MATQSGDLVFVGIKGTVVALDKSSGTEVWRKKLVGSEFVNLVVEDGNIYASTRGRIFCLSPASGEIRWDNPLKGLGLRLVTIAGPGGQVAAMREKIRRDEVAAAAGAAAAASA